MKIRIADISFELSDIKANSTNSMFNKYPGNGDSEHIIKVENQEVIDDIKNFEGEMPRNCAVNNIIYRKVADCLPLHNAFLLHSACFDVDGVGVAFAAHSGTGKTTHMLLWQKLLGDRLKIVNGDKPIIRFFEDDPASPYAYGTPWCGKERLGCNMRTPLRHICFIERAEENSCAPINASDAVNRIFNQVYMPADPKAAACTLELVNRLLSSCKLWLIRCNMDISAAETSYNAIFGK